MKFKIALACLLGCLTACSASQAPVADASDNPPAAAIAYDNDRFGFHVSVPRDFSPQGESDNGDGQVFLSADGRAEIRAYGSWLMEPEITCTAEAAHADDAAHISYRRQIGDTSFVSGTVDDRIFYTKVIRASDRCLTLSMQYPSKENQAYDAVVQSIATSFKG